MELTPMATTASFRLIVILLSGFGLGGCAAVAIEGGQAAKSEVIISQNIKAAESGDAKAQFSVGEAYCCSLNEGSGLFNTRTSVEWLCKAARQNYAPAMFKLGKIYSGDTIDGIRLARRAAAGVVGTSTNFPVAAAWLRLADMNGERAAGGRLADVWKDMSAADRTAAQRLFATGVSNQCLWNEVITSSR
jgi:TPR repeat protein